MAELRPNLSVILWMWMDSGYLRKHKNSLFGWENKSTYIHYEGKTRKPRNTKNNGMNRDIPWKWKQR